MGRIDAWVSVIFHRAPANVSGTGSARFATQRLNSTFFAIAALMFGPGW